MRKVVITGTLASFDKGDSAMVLAAAAELRRVIADVEIIVASPFCQIDRTAYTPNGIRVVATQRLRRHRSFLHMLAGQRLAGHFPFTWTDERYALETADLVLDLSGDAFSTAGGAAGMLRHLYPLWLARQFKTPVVLCGQTVGPFGMHKPWVRRLLRGASMITVRDSESRDYLLQQGFPESALEVTADIAHLLTPAPFSDVDRALERVPPDLWTRPVIGVAIAGPQGLRNRVRASRRLPRVVAALAEALKKLSVAEDVSLLLVAHRTGPGAEWDDRYVTHQLADRLGRTPNVCFMRENLSAPVMSGILGRCGMVIGMRVHALITALAQGVPVLALGDAPHLQRALSAWGEHTRIVDFGSRGPEALAECVANAWQQREAVAAGLSLRRRDVMALARRNIERAAPYLRHRLV